MMDAGWSSLEELKIDNGRSFIGSKKSKMKITIRLKSKEQ